MAGKAKAAFDQGQDPRIVLVDATQKEKLGFKLESLAVALKKYLAEHFTPVWGVSGVVGISRGQEIPQDTWAVVLLDDADAANAFGYHDVTSWGMPMSKVFVSVCRKNGEDVSMTVSHEIVEMLVDPGIQLMAMGPGGMFYAYEVADAIQGSGFEVGGFSMTNFMYPSWFEEFREKGKFDHMGRLNRPFQIEADGYMPIWKEGKGWTQLFGSKVAGKQFKLEDHPRTMLRTNLGAGIVKLRSLA